MCPSANTQIREILTFIGGLPAGLLQILVAAARPSTFNRIIACPTYPVPSRTSGLSKTVSLFHETLLSKDIHTPTFLANLFMSVRPLKERKPVGQFFTAASVAEWALSVVTPHENDHVCDAGAGTGVFADLFLRKRVKLNSYVGVENDPILTLSAAHILEKFGAPESYKIWYANFLLLTTRDFQKYDLPAPTFIISNPPYVRSQRLGGRDKIRADVKKNYAIQISPFAGSGSYFLSRAAELADRNAKSNIPSISNPRLLFFLPKESSGAEHAVRLRDDLKRIHSWTWKEYEIEEKYTGVDRHPSNTAALCFVFEQKGCSVGIPSGISSNNDFCLQNLLQVRRGISTGKNEFFVLTDNQVNEKRISPRYLRAILPTKIQLNEVDLCESIWTELCVKGHPCWMLSLPECKIDDFEVPVQEYLREGLREGVHLSPTSRSRRYWFSIPLPKAPPDVFITYLFRGSPRFILNSARVLNLTNILGGRFELPIESYVNQIAIINLLNDQARRWMTYLAPGREYKKGLRKIEPKELSSLEIDNIFSAALQRLRVAIKSPERTLFAGFENYENPKS